MKKTPLLLIAFFCTTILFAQTSRRIVATSPSTSTQTFSAPQIFEMNRDAVIMIRGVCPNGFRQFGSGFFLNSAGAAVTNHHVVCGLDSATAILYDGREFPVTKYYSYCFENDLAVVQVDIGNERTDYVTLGNSDRIRVGENIFSIGSPHGDPNTITSGIVSRIARDTINIEVYSLVGMIQSTAAIYGGSSGGPLLDDRGNVIGINVAGCRIRPSVQFSVPINRLVLPEYGASVNKLPIGTPDPHTYSPLIGRWHSTSSSFLDIGFGNFPYFYILTFNIDGTGLIEYKWVTDRQIYLEIEFTWNTANGVVTINSPDNRIRTIYSVTGKVLSTSFDGSVTSQYISLNEIPPATTNVSSLFGTWRSNTLTELDIGWGYHPYFRTIILNADGLGFFVYEYVTDGQNYGADAFMWDVTNDTLVFYFIDGLGIDTVPIVFTIERNVLTTFDDDGSVIMQYSRVDSTNWWIWIIIPLVIVCSIIAMYLRKKRKKIENREELNHQFEELKLKQNVPLAIIASVTSAIVTAVLWAVITVITGFQIGYMAIGVGFMVGFAVRFAGKGIDRIYGIIGAIGALFGCVLGNFLSQVGFIAQDPEVVMSYFEVLKFLLTDMQLTFEIMLDYFLPIDLLFYGIAIFAGYYYSFRSVDSQENHSF